MNHQVLTVASGFFSKLLEIILDAANKHLKGNELTEDARNRVGVVAKMVERQLVIDREEEARKKESESKEGSA